MSSAAGAALVHKHESFPVAKQVCCKCREVSHALPIDCPMRTLTMQQLQASLLMSPKGNGRQNRTLRTHRTILGHKEYAMAASGGLFPGGMGVLV